jgi:hypothetical protein
MCYDLVDLVTFDLSVRLFNLSPRTGIPRMKHPEKVTILAVFSHPSKERHQSSHVGVLQMLRSALRYYFPGQLPEVAQKMSEPRV